MAGAEGVEGVEKARRWVAVTVVAHCWGLDRLLLLLLLLRRRKGVDRTFLTLDSKSTELYTRCSRIRFIPSQGLNCGEGLFRCLVKSTKSICHLTVMFPLHIHRSYTIYASDISVNPLASLILYLSTIANAWVDPKTR